MEAVPSPLLPEEDHQQQEQQEEKEEEEEEKDEDMEGDEDSLSVDDHLSGKFTWTVEHFSELNVRKIYSETFVIGGHQWRILLFPKGNNVDFLSIYLDVADASSLPCDWARHAHFSLAVINQIDRKTSIRKETQHKFNEKENDWGFTSFIRLQEVCDTTKGYLVDDKLVVEVDVIVHRTSDYVAYKSKKETGYVGLKNQGATCYMNSLLQTLFHIPYFRKAVYHMPTTEADMLFNNIPLALQRLFYKIQYSDTTVSTKDLTRSFGWDSYESFMQHDAQEFNRVLCEKLEDKMKGTAVEGTIQQLFEGHHMNYIECINVDYKSTRKDSFYDLQLDVKGCKDVYESFDKYVEVEKLEGDNNYHAEHYGLQDAKKGVLFIDFPPVLQLQLKRFEYDFAKNTMVKINDRYEFPLQLDLDRDNHRYLSPDADRSMRNFYSLHSVLVHSGGVNGGHYYAFIRPTLSDQWYKFDDERVTKEKMKTAVGEQYGGEEELPQRNPVLNRKTFKFTKYSNAYMLVYIRDNDKDKIICNIDEKDIAHHLQVRLKNEQEIKEIKRKEKDESQLYTVIKLVQDQDLRSQIGKDIYFDLVDHDKVWAFRIQKQELFNNFKQVVFGEFGIPISFQRYWWWAKRQNQTYRLKKTLVISEESKTVGQLQELSDMKQSSELRLFLETNWSINKELALPPDEICQDGILLFFKLYNPEKQELRYIGRKFVQGLAKPAEIIEELNKMAGFSPNEEIQLYEEIKFEPEIICDKIDQRVTFKGSQLADGDIICIQKALQSEGQKPYLYPDFPSYLEYIQNRQVVHFRRLEKPKEDEFCLELSKKNTYNEVTERVARELCLDEPLKIRLTAHNCYAQQTKSKPMEYRTKERLSDMLTHYNKTSDILYFETLDIPLPELQGLKTLKVAYHNSTTEEVSVLNIRLPKQSTIRDVIEDIKIKVELSDPMEELRILEVFYHKIYKVFSLNDKIENINDQYWTLRAEKIPEEEREVGDLDRVIQVCHFICDQAQNNTIHIENFGDPFFLVIHVNETLAEVKLRVQKKLEVADEEFSKWKIAFVSFGSRGYLKDSDVLIDYFQKRDIATWQHYLGLEHTDSSAKRLQHSNQNWHALQKPVIIYN